MRSKKTKNRMGIIVIVIEIIVILIAIILFTNKFLISYSPSDPKFDAIYLDSCGDSDGDFDLVTQSKTKSITMYLHKEANCPFTSLNKLNATKDVCGFTLVYQDYCISDKTLREKTCKNNKIDSINIKCQTICFNGKCQ